jgi:hypothetical protein
MLASFFATSRTGPSRLSSRRVAGRARCQPNNEKGSQGVSLAMGSVRRGHLCGSRIRAGVHAEIRSSRRDRRGANALDRARVPSDDLTVLEGLPLDARLASLTPCISRLRIELHPCFSLMVNYDFALSRNESALC